MLWHYTTVDALKQIVTSGAIRTQETVVIPGQQHAVWFTLSTTWEETANVSYGCMGQVTHLDRQGTFEHYGLARIGVATETAPHTWRDYKRLGGVASDYASQLYAIGTARGSRIGDWRVSFEDVPQSQWLAIEVWDGEQWHVIGDLTLIERLPIEGRELKAALAEASAREPQSRHCLAEVPPGRLLRSKVPYARRPTALRLLFTLSCTWRPGISSLGVATCPHRVLPQPAETPVDLRWRRGWASLRAGSTAS